MTSINWQMPQLPLGFTSRPSSVLINRADAKHAAQAFDHDRRHRGGRAIYDATGARIRQVRYAGARRRTSELGGSAPRTIDHRKPNHNEIHEAVKGTKNHLGLSFVFSCAVFHVRDPHFGVTEDVRAPRHFGLVVVASKSDDVLNNSNARGRRSPSGERRQLSDTHRANVRAAQPARDSPIDAGDDHRTGRLSA